MGEYNYERLERWRREARGKKYKIKTEPSTSGFGGIDVFKVYKDRKVKICWFASL